MKRNKLLILGAAFALAIGAVTGVVTGKRASAVYAESVEVFTPGTDTGATSVTKGDITATMTTMNNASYYQIYASQSGTFSSANGNITKIEFSCTASGTSKYGPGNASTNVGSYSYDGADGTWVGSALSVTLSSTAQIRMTSLTITYEPSGVSQYTLTYDANGGTGTMTDDNSPYQSGLEATVLGNEFERDGYSFVCWNTAADGSGDDYEAGGKITMNGNKVLYAQWAENPIDGIRFSFSSNPGGWPTDNSTTLTNYTYSIGDDDYTFALKNVKCNSGYLMVTAVGVLGLPAISDQKLTKVVASNSGGCSTSVKVGISSSDSSDSYITGGAAQTWSTQGSSYTYTLSDTTANTVYYLYITNKNAQITSLTLTYEDVPVSSTITVTYNANGATSGTVPTDGNEYESGDTVTVLGNTGDLAKTNYVFDGWNTKADGSGANYDEGGTFNITSNVTLYANWTALGTESNPFTVTQAKAAIDAAGNNATISDVYVQGIISQIDSFNSQYSSITYWISEDGTTANQFEVYSGKGLNSANFTSMENIELCASVVVCGSIKKYNGIYEFNYNNYLCSYNKPVLSSITLNGNYPTTFIVGDDFSYENMVVTATFENGASKVVEINSDFTFSGYDMSSSGNQTVTVSYTKDGVTKTANYSIVVEPPKTLTGLSLIDDTPEKVSYFGGEQFNPNGLVVYGIWDGVEDTSENIASSLTWTPNPLVPGNTSVTGTYRGESVVVDGLTVSAYTVAQMKDLIDAAGDTPLPGVYVQGKVSQVDSYNSTYNSITYWISADGTTNEFKIYGGLRSAENPFASKDDIEVGASVIVYGEAKKYNGDYELDKNNLLFSYEAPSFDLDHYLQSAHSLVTVDGTESYDSEDVLVFGSSYGESDVTFDSSNPASLANASLTFEKAGGQYDPKYVSSQSGLRLYGSNTITITATGSDSLSYIKFETISGDVSKLTSSAGSISNGIWTGSSSSLTITNSDTKQINISSIKIGYGDVDVNNVALRFGAKVAEADWLAIKSKWGITDYGVMLIKSHADKDHSSETNFVQELFNSNGTRPLVVKKTGDEGNLPYADPTVVDGYYTFTVKINIPSNFSHTDIYYAAPFICIGGQYRFLDEKHGTIDDFIDENDGTNLSQAALNSLK